MVPAFIVTVPSLKSVFAGTASTIIRFAALLPPSFIKSTLNVNSVFGCWETEVQFAGTVQVFVNEILGGAPTVVTIVFEVLFPGTGSVPPFGGAIVVCLKVCRPKRRFR